MKRIILLLSFCIAFSSVSTLLAQGLRGQVLDPEGVPIPFANLFLDEINSGTSSDEQGNYFLTIEAKGDYRIICSAIGYETLLDTIVIGDEMLTLNFQLAPSTSALDEIVVSASKRDPAFAIIKKVVDNRKKYLRGLNSFRAQVYVKATEDIETFEKEKAKEKKRKKIIEVETKPEDPFAVLEAEKQELLAGLNMIEMQMQLNYQFPKNYKEERSAYKLYGDKDGLFIPRYGETDFNFYRNQVSFSYLMENKIISPISSTAILSYKYKLLESLIEGDYLVHKIKVIPRKTGNATASGIIYINDELWNINRLELKLPKGGMKYFDALSIKQNYEAINDSLWLPTRQQFIYESKKGKQKKFKGNTTIRFQDLEINYPFPEKFFGHEISVTTAEAYKRDSTYWNTIRVEPLTKKEESVVLLRDSISGVLNSKPYQDSIQTAYNKVTLLDVIWDGIGFRSYEHKSHLYFSSLPSLIDFEVIGGFRLGPFISYFKRWENGVSLYTYGNGDIGLRNGDVQGLSYISMRYLPMRQGDAWLNGGRTFNSINDQDAYLNQLRSSNYILSDAMNAGHKIELINGLYLENIFSFADRQSVARFDTRNFLTEVITDEPAIEFEQYQSFITSIKLSFTPGQKYLTEPNRKVVIGSSFPTFSILHKKGWDAIFSSDIDFDYLEFEIRQNIEFGSFGNTKYFIQTGKFVNTKDLRFFDIKRFRESDPILYSKPLDGFQLLDTSLNTSNLYVEFHHIHHFNGALINNIPLIKKTNVRVVAGAGFLWVPDSQLRHEEVFTGLERVFKLGPRRRLRVGVYGVLASSSIAKPDTTFKISFDLIDTWKRDWSF